MNPCMRACVHPSDHSFIQVSIHPPKCTSSRHPSIYPSKYLFIHYPFICPFDNICRFSYPSIYLCTHLDSICHRIDARSCVRLLDILVGSRKNTFHKGRRSELANWHLWYGSSQFNVLKTRRLYFKILISASFGKIERLGASEPGFHMAVLARAVKCLYSICH
jgi:hypothetical protein